MPKHVLLTGLPGVGKTTLIKKICDFLKSKHIDYGGFYTEEVRQGTRRIGFNVVTVCGETGCLARSSDVGNFPGPKVGKYVVDIHAFENLALPCLEIKGSTIIVIDEIGKMELFSKKFQSQVQDIFDKSEVQVLATVPIRNNIGFIESIKKRNDVLLFIVTQDNRDTMLEEVLSNLSD